MKTLEFDTVIQRNETRFIATDFDAELVMMDLESGTYIRLNKTAKVIWEQLKEPATLDQLVNSFLSVYKVEECICRKEVIACLIKMREEGIVLF